MMSLENAKILHERISNQVNQHAYRNSNLFTLDPRLRFHLQSNQPTLSQSIEVIRCGLAKEKSIKFNRFGGKMAFKMMV